MLNCYISYELLMSYNYSSQKHITIFIDFNNVLELLIRSLDFYVITATTTQKWELLKIIKRKQSIDTHYKQCFNKTSLLFLLSSV